MKSLTRAISKVERAVNRIEQSMVVFCLTSSMNADNKVQEYRGKEPIFSGAEFKAMLTRVTGREW